MLVQLPAALTAVLCPQARTLSGRSRVQGGFEDVFSLEVLGPVLPHALHALTLVLGPAQRGAFRALLSPHEPSAAFNAGPGPPQVRIHLPRPCPGMGRGNRDLPLAGLGTEYPGSAPGGPGLIPLGRGVMGAPQRDLLEPRALLTQIFILCVCLSFTGGCAAGPPPLRAASQDFGSAESVSHPGKIVHPLAGNEGLQLHMEGLGMVLCGTGSPSWGC